jgi:hypothetical protein
MVAFGKAPILAARPAIDDFYSCRVVKAEGTLAQAKAEGACAAKAPIVAFIEDHTRFSKGWATALLKAHKEDNVAVVGPAFVNANPATSVSWANMLVEYSPWLSPVERRPFAFLPGNNSSYKRDVLLKNYGERLGEMLDTECVLHWDLHANGHKLMMEPEAMTSHINPSLLKPSLSLRLLEGRHFASDRARLADPAARGLCPGSAAHTACAIREDKKRRRREARRDNAPTMDACFARPVPRHKRRGRGDRISFWPGRDRHENSRRRP